MDYPPGDRRVVRVFVSSTFRDMQAERDELAKRTFPALRKLCESRGVTWGEVDLRWGLTEEQQAEGQVLPVCLAEIARCRPYFIGILGERYGWVPETITPSIVESEPWLAEYRGRSVTELEILHGALNAAAVASRALLYLRDPSYVDGKPVADYCETPSPADIASVGAKEAKRRADERRARLDDLKARIRSAGLRVREDYRDPRALGEAVYADLSTLIEERYPAGSEPDQLERERAEQDAYSASRISVYVGRRDYVQSLDAHAAGVGLPLTILGEAGAGKSALLANWAASYRVAHPNEPVVVHFVGASASSGDWASMLRRIIGELSRQFGLELEIPDEPNELRLAFTSVLHRAGAKGRAVVVIDALNQLEDRGGALELTWLPPAIPPNIRLVLSTLPGRSLTELEKRSYPTLVVAPLELRERRQLVVDYLASYTKTLEPALLDRVANSPQSANPLFLRALLDELRVWGEHYTLSQKVDHYLAASSVDALYERILARYEADYERGRTGLVGEAFSLIWASRRGLSETELLELLGADGRPLQAAYWSPLSLAAEALLTSRSGYVSLFHDHARAAIEHRYLPDDASKGAAHLRLADYFSGRDFGPRMLDELPWQLGRAAAWPRLNETLADLAFLQAASDADHFDLRAAWARLEAGSSYRMQDTYRPLIAAPADFPSGQVFLVGALLREAGRLEPALLLHEHLAARYRQKGDRENLAASLGNQAVIRKARGDLEGAMQLLKEAEQICRELDNRADLQACLGNQGLVMRALGDLDGAMAKHQEEEQISRELGDRHALSGSLGNQAVILRSRGDLDGALDLEQQQERICRELGDPAGLQVSLGNQANIRFARGELEKSMDLHREEERICRELGDPASLQGSLGNQALILKAWGDLDGALELHAEEEGICRDLEDLSGLQASLGNQGLVMRARGELDRALELYREQEAICRGLGNRGDLQASLGNQAAVLQIQGDLDGAITLIDEQEQICRDLEDPLNLQAAIANRANVFLARGDLAAAMRLYKEQEEICRQLRYPAGLQVSLGNQAIILKRRGDPAAALSLHKEEEAICRELGDPEALATSLANQAMILVAMGRQVEASRILREAYHLASTHGLTRLVRQLEPQVQAFP